MQTDSTLEKLIETSRELRLRSARLRQSARVNFQDREANAKSISIGEMVAENERLLDRAMELCQQSEELSQRIGALIRQQQEVQRPQSGS